MSVSVSVSVSKLSVAMNINRTKECCDSKRKIDLALKEGDDFVIFRPCNCLACPKCAFNLCCNRKDNTPICPNHKIEIDQAMFFKSSREKPGKAAAINVKKYHTDIEKEPGRVFMREFEKIEKE